MIPREKEGELYEGNSLIRSFDAFEIYVNPWKEEREREIKKGNKREANSEEDNRWMMAHFYSSHNFG